MSALGKLLMNVLRGDVHGLRHVDITLAVIRESHNSPRLANSTSCIWLVLR